MRRSPTSSFIMSVDRDKSELMVGGRAGILASAAAVGMGCAKATRNIPRRLRTSGRRFDERGRVDLNELYSRKWQVSTTWWAQRRRGARCAAPTALAADCMVQKPAFSDRRQSGVGRPGGGTSRPPCTARATSGLPLLWRLHRQEISNVESTGRTEDDAGGVYTYRPSRSAG